MQNMQFSEFPHLWGHSSGCAVIWDIFRDGWHPTMVSGISLWRGVLSRTEWWLRVWLTVFHSDSKYLPGRPYFFCAIPLEGLLAQSRWALHPPRAVVCRPRQTRGDVHVLVAIMQLCCFINLAL